MKQKPYKWIAVVAFVVAVVGGWLVWQRDSEPRYEGKTVKAWLSKVERDDSIFWTPEICLMLDKLGSNAVPPLIEILAQGKTPVKDWFCVNALQSGWAPKFIQSIAGNHLHNSTALPQRAHQALQSLSTNAASAIPDLERIICDPRAERGWPWAFVVLANLGPAARPALQRSLTNAPTARRPALKLAIGVTSEDAEVRRITTELLRKLPETEPSKKP